ncbi:MAG: RHS repeat-associated core domain-containing protein [Pseudomonas sp.]
MKWPSRAGALRRVVNICTATDIFISFDLLLHLLACSKIVFGIASMSTVYLLQTNRQQSVLGGTGFPSRAYSAFGAIPGVSGPMQCFAGEVRDPLTGCYHLGKGHRVFNPVLMRFHSADRLSPFDKGGVNSYAYCRNDPVNFNDPSGQFPSLIALIRAIFAGLINLGISVLRAYRGFSRMRDFNLNRGHGGSRAGELTFGTAENPVSPWSVRERVTAVIGTASASANIGTSVARLAAVDNEALIWVDTAFAAVATASSAYELYTMAREPRIGRYPIDQYEMSFRSQSSPTSTVARVRGQP